MDTTGYNDYEYSYTYNALYFIIRISLLYRRIYKLHSSKSLTAKPRVGLKIYPSSVKEGSYRIA